MSEEKEKIVFAEFIRNVRGQHAQLQDLRISEASETLARERISEFYSYLQDFGAKNADLTAEEMLVLILKVFPEVGKVLELADFDKVKGDVGKQVLAGFVQAALSALLIKFVELRSGGLQ